MFGRLLFSPGTLFVIRKSLKQEEIAVFFLGRRCSPLAVVTLTPLKKSSTIFLVFSFVTVLRSDLISFLTLLTNSNGAGLGLLDNNIN